MTCLVIYVEADETFRFETRLVKEPGRTALDFHLYPHFCSYFLIVLKMGHRVPRSNLTNKYIS